MKIVFLDVTPFSLVEFMFVSEELAASFRSSIYQTTRCHIPEDIDVHEIVFDTFWAVKMGTGGTFMMIDHKAAEVVLVLWCPWDRFNRRYSKVLQFIPSICT
jgi:hypothetical protein